MPRSGDTYSLPAGTTAQPNTTIKSANYNAFTADVAQTFNGVQPVSLGGTGATTAEQARINLGISTEAEEGPILVVAAGQSNMWGNELADTGSKTTNDNVYAWDYDADTWVTAEIGATPFRPRVTQSITGITQANPAVVTYSGSDIYYNGSTVTLSGVVGMTQVNGNTYTVANVNTGANTFELSGTNSSGYGAYSSGGTITGPYAAANNPAFHFCDRLQEETGRDVYLVLLAVPATAIAKWLTVANGGASETTNNYEDPAPTSPTREKLQLLVEAAIASTTMVDADKTQIDVFLWHQGESDDSRGYDDYHADVLTFIDQVKAETWWGSHTKFIAGEMSRAADYSNALAVYRAIHASGSVENFSLASSDSLATTIDVYATTGDTTHFSGAALRIFGRERYYAAYLAVPIPYMPSVTTAEAGSVVNVPAGTSSGSPYDASVAVSGVTYAIVENSVTNYIDLDPATAQKGCEINIHNFSTSGLGYVTFGALEGENAHTGARNVTSAWVFPNETLTFKKYGQSATGDWRIEHSKINPDYRFRSGDRYEPLNAIGNGHFVAQDTGWTLNTWAVDATVDGIVPGTPVMKNTDTSGTAKDLVAYEGAWCVEGDRVRATCRIKTTATPTISNFRMLLSFYDESDALIGSATAGTGNTADNSSAWATLTVEDTAPATAKYAVPSIRVAKTVGTVYVSNVQCFRLRSPQEFMKLPQTATSLGTKTSGTTTLTPFDGEYQYYTNNGAHTLAPPSVTGDYEIKLTITNDASAGAITTSGFSKVTGSFTTTNGHDFLCRVTKLNSFTHLEIIALQ